MPQEILHTPRLVLSPPTIADLPRLLELADDPVIGAMTLNVPHPYTEAAAVFWINASNEGRQNGDAYVFALRDRESLAFLGGIGIHLNRQHKRGEIGYWIGAPHRGKGLVTETVGRILRFGFEELDLHRIQATHLPANVASGKVMLNNHMTAEGTLEDYYYKNGEPRSVRLYRILRPDFLARTQVPGT